MTKRDLPPQPPVIEKVQSKEQLLGHGHDVGDFALLAEFYAQRFAATAETASAGTKRTAQKDADEMTRAQGIFADLDQAGFRSLPEANRMLDELERGIVDGGDEEVSAEDEDENEKTLRGIERARLLLKQNAETDIYEKKDFAAWLEARNARAREEKLARRAQESKARSAATATAIDAAYHQLGVESPAERERSRERAAAIVLQDGGVRIYMSVDNGLSQSGKAGAQNLELRIQDGLQPNVTRGIIEGQLLSDAPRGDRLEDVMKQRGIKEIIDIRGVVRDVYEAVTISGKKGILGLGATPDRVERRPTGRREPIMHNEIVRAGKEEPTVRFTYLVPPTQWRDYTGREGQMMSVEILLPESSAQEVTQTIERDPAAMRRIVERVMKDALLKDPNAWDVPQGHGDALRPPYEDWDAEAGGSRIYVQTEQMAPGFHEEALRKIEK